MSDSTSHGVLFIPEIAGIDARSSIIRVPPELDVPLTPRVRRIIDSPAFRRLAGVSQLGFVRLVYPGATHTRFEHSLGVYRIALLLLKRLAHDSRFTALVTPGEAEVLILAALLHDVGHFPFCHLLEDLRLPGMISHEQAAEEYILGELSEIIRHDWHVNPVNICDVLMKREPERISNEPDSEYSRRKKAFKLLASILSGPIDVDKMDYLMRDSHGAGVPYGKNYDLERLVGSVCLNESGDGVAISNKGKTAAELMVFARYVMFSEVYWHHTSRAATVMFQRALNYLGSCSNVQKLVDDVRRTSDYQFENYLLGLCQTEEQASDAITPNPARQAAQKLLLSLFGGERKLFKRLREFSLMEAPGLYQRIAGRPYPEVCRISDLLAKNLGIEAEQLLIDAPPADKEVEFKIDVFFPHEGVYRPLSEVSPVVRALAREQFDDYVKRVRIFVAPEIALKLRSLDNLDARIQNAIDDAEA